MSRSGKLGCVAVVLLGLGLPPVRSGVPVDAVRGHVAYLASPKLEGRLTGSAGERKAAAYLARELKALGGLPLPGQDEFQLPFGFTAGTRDAGSTLELRTDGSTRPRRWRGTGDVRALSFSDSSSASGRVVFAGYGLVVPEGQGPSYDSYAGLDVTDKIVLVLRYFPEDAGEELRASLARHAGLRYKAMNARERGARALLVATGPRSPNAGKTVDLSFDAALAGSGIVAGSISGRVAAEILEPTGKDLEELQHDLDTGNPHVVGFEVPGVDLTLNARLEREARTGHNVVGYLPATVGAGDSEASYVMLGAHYDHLGRGLHGNSLAREGESGRVHLGADDNASGVAAVLAAGAELAREQRLRPVLLAFWSGEELGLLGANAFVKTAPVPLDRVAAYVNLDMVGRMTENRLSLQGVGSSSAWPRLIEQVNVRAGFDARTQEDPYLPTDSQAFYQAGIPTLNLFTGGHEDYHRPSDRPEIVNYEDLARVAEFAVAVVGKLGALEEDPDYVKVAPKTDSGGSRDSVRAYTGTIPDYATEVEGLRLGGVVPGGPADRAGLREGDVIVHFAGREIANIYDYTYALDAVKVNVPARVIIVRAGERIEVTITPTSRP